MTVMNVSYRDFSILLHSVRIFRVLKLPQIPTSAELHLVNSNPAISLPRITPKVPFLHYKSKRKSIAMSAAACIFCKIVKGTYKPPYNIHS